MVSSQQSSSTAAKPKVALVTGGSYGIGLEVCRTLRQDGYETYSFSRSAPRRAIHGMIHVDCDITSAKMVSDSLQLVRTPIDLMVNNASVLRRGGILDISEESFRELIETNIIGNWRMLRNTEPLLAEHATMIQISSFRAFRPREAVAVYGLTKQFMSELVLQLKPSKPIAIKIAFLGPTDSDMLKRDLEPERYEEVRKISITTLEAAEKIKMLRDSKFDMLVYDDLREEGVAGKGHYFLEHFYDDDRVQLD